MAEDWGGRARRLLGATPEWAWVLLAVALRLAFAWKTGGRFHQIDEVGYDAPAWSLAQTGTFSLAGEPWVGPPLPIAFFAACFRLFGHSLLFPRLAQAFVSAATAWALGRMTARLTDSPLAGRLALALAAVYPFFIYYSGMAISETLYLAAVVPGLSWLCASLQERGARLWRPAAAGAALAAAALCRVEAMPITAGIWAACAAACLAGRWPWRAWLVAVLVWSSPLLAWSGRNRAAAGVFALDLHGGMTMLHGTVLLGENEKDTSLAMAALEKMPFYQDSLALPPAARDRLYLRRAWDFMREDPGRLVRQWARKTVNFWRLYPRTDKAYHETVHSHPGAGLSRAVLVAVSLLCEPALIALGFWGLWFLGGRWRELFPLVLFGLGTMAIHVVSVSQMRYRLPVMPVLILAAAYCLLERKARSRSGVPMSMSGASAEKP